jgi:hypothetical protein
MGVCKAAPEGGAAVSSERIRELHDAFRTTFRGGRVVLSSSVQELPDCVKAEALSQVATYQQFTPENDPYEEHDFGAFELVARRFFWKIDYYDKECERGSEDPADPAKTTRVLTVMLNEDY